MVRNSLLWKLTIWFVLLSLLPIGVIVLFVRQDVSDELTDLVKNDIGSQISLLAHQAATSNDDRHLQDLVQGVSGGTHLASVVGQDGRYVAHGEASRVGERVSDDYSAEVVQRIVSGTTGVIVDEDSGRIVGFATLPMESRKVVLTVDKSVVSAPMLRIERSALVQLAVSLFVINVAIGVAVWVVFRPIRRLTAAAEEVGAGNLDVHIDPADMEGELEVLTNAFNEMTTKIRGAQEDLEQTVADRTEELRDSEERYRTLFEDSRNAIFISSGDGSVIDVNQAALELFAFSREEAIGSDIGSRFADPEDRDSFRSEIGRVGSIREFEVRLTRKDGTEIDCLLTATRQFDTDGSSLGVMGIIHDISERKQAEEQGMELVVLEERNRMAREIHDTLAQGFTGIVLQLEAAEQALDGDHADVEDHLDRAKRLARESLQEARRSVWDLVPRSLEERSLDAALQQTVDSWAEEGHESASFKRSGERSEDLGELPPQVQACLLRICQESLTNVRRHAKAIEVAVSMVLESTEARLTVKDDGEGFSMEDVKSRSGRKGFGLVGMEQRVSLLGGTLNVRSEIGKGTLVEAKMPLA